jgi:hypothetical protein
LEAEPHFMKLSMETGEHERGPRER